MTSFGHGAASFSGNTPFIVNIATPTAATEYSYALPKNTTKFSIRSRLNGKVQLAYTSGQSNTIFITVDAGFTYEIQGVELTSKTLYFRSTKNNDIIEIHGFSLS